MLRLNPKNACRPAETTFAVPAYDDEARQGSRGRGQTVQGITQRRSLTSKRSQNEFSDFSACRVAVEPFRVDQLAYGRWSGSRQAAGAPMR